MEENIYETVDNDLGTLENVLVTTNDSILYSLSGWAAVTIDTSYNYYNWPSILSEAPYEDLIREVRKRHLKKLLE